MSTYALDPWTALGDPSRRQIFERIAERPRSVTELAELLPISRPAVSQHLRALREANLVTVRAVGTRRIHQVNPDGLRTLRNDLDSYWGGALANLKELAEQETQP
ncbi:ArsR/SmtB family transcription factor [Ornithinicoccus halotolerans]|uniref:ArsR/SmtB family transcription factor n=1 Tax=Ornithinicoccus halotolerans TaxID=1748220 RepID=UPI001295290F|nr:metalloregulator ArsR/SmtB family transcription factor [Ornithinicoccus halotolerans]